MTVVLLGGPGCGKGTQGPRLAAHFGLAYLSSGDLLRRAVTAGTPLGRRAEPYMRQGAFVPDEIVVPAAIEEIVKVQQERAGAVLDGFPRTADQAAVLEGALANAGSQVDVACVLDVRPETAVARLSSRWSCLQCGTPFNLISKPPRVTGVCDSCGSALAQRDDDRAETVRRRLAVADATLRPLAGYYAGRGCLISVDGERVEKEVTRALAAAVASTRPVPLREDTEERAGTADALLVAASSARAAG